MVYNLIGMWYTATTWTFCDYFSISLICVFLIMTDCPSTIVNGPGIREYLDPCLFTCNG